MPAVMIFDNTGVQGSIETKPLVLDLATKHSGSQEIENVILQ